jgi:hypothetical protein
MQCPHNFNRTAEQIFCCLQTTTNLAYELQQLSSSGMKERLASTAITHNSNSSAQSIAVTWVPLESLTVEVSALTANSHNSRSPSALTPLGSTKELHSPCGVPTQSAHMHAHFHIPTKVVGSLHHASLTSGNKADTTKLLLSNSVQITGVHLPINNSRSEVPET